MACQSSEATSRIDFPKHEEIMHHPKAAKLGTGTDDRLWLAGSQKGGMEDTTYRRTARKTRSGTSPDAASVTSMVVVGGLEAAEEMRLET